MFRCRRVEVFRFRDSGRLGSAASLVKNEGTEEQEIITISGLGVKFLADHEYDINVLVDGQDWQTMVDNDPKELGYTGG